MEKTISRYQVATSIAIFFHFIGLMGLLFFNNAFFVRSTPFNLLLSFLLLVWTQHGKNIAFLIFVGSVLLIGFFAEVAGINTGLVFGDYGYGKVLGFQWHNVPLVIGINWFIIIYCCGVSTQTLLLKALKYVSTDNKEAPKFLKAMSIIIDGATLAVAFDWLMEPVAVSLGFWKWGGNGGIPLYNYTCWFLVSVILLSIFHLCPFDKENKFAVNLLLIQVMFFLVLRTFMT